MSVDMLTIQMFKLKRFPEVKVQSLEEVCMINPMKKHSYKEALQMALDLKYCEYCYPPDTKRTYKKNEKTVVKFDLVSEI